MMSMPRLPAWLVSALPLVQPTGSLALGAAFLGERPDTHRPSHRVIRLVAEADVRLIGRGLSPRACPDGWRSYWVFARFMTVH
jgi:hypothetical protein